jgi:hypothetical protein
MKKWACIYHSKYNNFLNVNVSSCMIASTVKPVHAATSVMQSHVLKSHLFFLSCHRNFHMNWTSFKRSSILEDHSFFITEMTSKYRFDYIFNWIELSYDTEQFFNPSPFPILITKLKEVCAVKGQGTYRILAL